MVQGHADKVNTTNADGTPMTKADKITPREEWYVGIAIEKACPEWPAFLMKVQQIAAAFWPGGQSQNQTPGAFAWKILDGDAPVNAQKVGFPGHWVLRCSTGFKPTLWDQMKNQLPDGAVARGSFVRVGLVIKSNGVVDPLKTPGIHLNTAWIQLIGYGEPIGGDGPTPGDAPAVGFTPAGMSAVPVAGAVAPPPPLVQPMPIQPQAAVPPQPMPVAAPVPIPANPGMLQVPVGGAVAPVPQPMPPQPVVATVPNTYANPAPGQPGHDGAYPIGTPLPVGHIPF